MTPPPMWPADRVTRASRTVLRVLARMVPPARRPSWLSEWEAELWQLRSGERGTVGLIRFLSGAGWHGLYESWEGWNVANSGQDIRYAARMLRRSPGFTLAAVVLLGSSIGASTALFSVLERAVLADPPFPDPDRLVVVDQLFGDTPASMNPAQWSYPRFVALTEEVRSLETAAGFSSRTMTLTEVGQPVIVSVEAVTPSYFPLLGIDAVAGRAFGPDEVDGGSAELVALVSHGFWTSRLGADPQVAGSTLVLDQVRLEVVGVLPPGFEGITGEAQIWIPMSALREIQDASFLEDPWNLHFNIVARLAGRSSLAAANDELSAFGAGLKERFPAPVAASRLAYDVAAVSFREARTNPLAKQSMVSLFVAVLLVLLVATANLAGLLLARSATRQREAALRSSLGAGSGRILRQFLTESLVLAALGGAVGLALAHGLIGLLGTWLADTLGTQGGRGLQYFDPDTLAISWQVAGFAVALTTAAGVAFGLLPAWQAAGADPNASLRGGGRGTDGSRLGNASRDGLIVVQVGIAIVLLTGAALMLQNLSSLQRVELGYDRENGFTAMYTLTATDELAGIDPGRFHLDFLERVRALPGVEGATLGEVPHGGPTWRTIVMESEGRPELTAESHTWIRLQPVPDGHFEVMGIPVLEGRGIEATDDDSSDPVIVLNRVAAEELFPGGSPVGRRITLGWPELGGAGAIVVGVVPEVRLGPLSAPSERQAYVSIRQAPRLETGVIIRSPLPPERIAPQVRDALADQGGGNTALTSQMSMDERIAIVTERPRIVALLLTVLGGLTTFLVAAGLYGTIAYVVASRTRELGLRLSLGADPAAVIGLVVRQSLIVTLLGIVLGVLIALRAGRMLEPLMLEPPGVGWAAIGTVSGLLLVVALAAALGPALRATRIDPMVALRAD